MIDPILSLAFSIHSNKGVYALLLGSGISRAAGIPTGWEVTLDLIRKLAHMKNENCEPAPDQWYQETFTEDAADYSKLLKQIAKTSSERNRLLKAYFEPTEDERQQNLKTPTDAHKAIASLVVKGYIKVILTTNFDRLMEKALEEAGITPTVISSTDAIHGATPITHSSCTLIKLHGDYLDTRIKNTPEELSIYDKRLNSLLDSIFDEFGLIICGWSGEWDIALCKTVERCQSRRYTTFWTVKDVLGEKAKGLAHLRKAEVIKIQSADLFFNELAEKLLAIDDFERPHPLSAQVAVVTFKKYLEEDKYKIRLHDLVVQETEKLFQNISQEFYPTQNPRPDNVELIRRVKQFEAKTEILQSIMITGVYWGKQSVGNLFIKSLERLADHQKDQNGYEAWKKLQLYPALIVLFSTGLAALAADNYDMLASLLTKPINKYAVSQTKEPLIVFLHPHAVIGQDLGRLLPNMERRHTPTSDHLVEILATPLREYIPDQFEFENQFDRLEYLISLVIMDHLLQTRTRAWAPIGRFGWRHRESREHISTQIQNEIDNLGSNWKPLQAGLFSGTFDRALNSQRHLVELLERINWW